MNENLTPYMESALTQFRQDGNFDGYHHNTINALKRRGIIENDDSGYRLVSESEAAPRTNKLMTRYINRGAGTMPTFDVGQADYQFWDRLRKGLVEGLELGGLFIKPMASRIAAWSFGIAPRIKTGSKKADDFINDWWNNVHADVLRSLEESIALGDSYAVVNADQTVSVIPPQVVQPMVDDDDYSRVNGYMIEEVHQHPIRYADTMVITDEYSATKRVRTINKNGQKKSTTYKNFAGIVPVVPISHDVGADERHGHPFAEALVRKALRMYDALFQYAFDGNKRQGRPTPVIEEMGTMEEVNKFWEMFGVKRSRTLPDGTVEDYYIVDFDADNLLTLGNSAKFKWAAPGSFSKDTEVLLGLLFYLVLQHTEIPEFIWGNAIASSKASAESQMPPFVKFIEKLQGQYVKWIKQIISVALAYEGLWNPDVDRNNLNISVRFPKLTDEDGKLTIEALKLVAGYGLLPDETILELAPLDIENPREVLEKAREEQAEKQAERDRRDEEMLNSLRDNDQPTDDEEPDNDETPEETTDEMHSAVSRVISEQHTGVMIALKIDPQTALRLRQLTLRAGVPESQVLPANEYHITLAYLGDAAEIASSKDALDYIVQKFVWMKEPIAGQVGGVGRFNTKRENEGLDPVYFSFDSPQVGMFRQQLVDALAEYDITVDEAHGFTPHITTAYIKSSDAMPNIRLSEKINLTFNSVHIAWAGDEWEEITFDEVSVEKAVVA